MNHCLTNVRMVTFLIGNGLIQVLEPFTCYESFDQNACMHVSCILFICNNCKFPLFYMYIIF